jgi:hypothetical protein
MMQGIDCPTASRRGRHRRRCFRAGLVIETSGSDDQVVKCLPPLEAFLDDAILREGARRCCDDERLEAIGAMRAYAPTRRVRTRAGSCIDGGPDP